MDFSLTAQQQDLRARVIAFAREDLPKSVAERDRSSSFDAESWMKCARFGLLWGNVPSELGGAGWDDTTTVVALEALGYGCRDNGLTLGVNSLVWTILKPLLVFGSASQKSKYIPLLCSGQWLAADGITELAAGSDAMAMQTTATRVEGGYTLNGTKSFIGFGPDASLALVLAKTQPAAGAWGISAFLVERGTKGFEQSPNKQKMGLRTLPMGDLTFENCFVPEGARLGPEGVGLSLFNTTIEWERSFILASHVGAMERQLEDCARFAKERKQFGKPIGSFQSVSNRIADMRARLETSKLLLYKAAWLKDRGDAAAMESAIANLCISEAFLQSSLDAVRIHGARGYVSEFEVERDLRDATGGVIYAGTSDILRNLIARMLGL